MSRRLLVTLHRWFGLFAAAFLFVSGTTGAIIAWEHELDARLNPDLFAAGAPGASLPPLELARRVEAADPRVRVSYLPLVVPAGEAALVYVDPRPDPRTHALPTPGYNQVAVDPASGAIQGRRAWGAVSLARHDLLPFVYRLHYSLHLPLVGGYDVGSLFMGVLAVAWVVDTLVALWISFPSWKTWRRSFAFRWTGGGPRLTFDLHRSGGTWLFVLVLAVAVTSVSMNLSAQVMRPLVSLFSTLSPSPFSTRAPVAPAQETVPAVTPGQALALARAEAHRRGWTAPPGGLSISPALGLYGVGFFDRAHIGGNGGLGNPWLYIDMRTGAIASVDVPGQGTAGDVFMQAMFPVHSGRILGMAGRVLTTLLGVAVATFSVTGVLIWARKRRARRHAATPCGVAESGRRPGGAIAPTTRHDAPRDPVART